MAQRVDGVAQVQLAGLLCALCHGTQARALQQSIRVMPGARHCRVDGTRQIEVTVAIGVRAREFEKGPCRGMQHVGLERGRARGDALEFQLEAQLLDRGKSYPQRKGGRPVAT